MKENKTISKLPPFLFVLLYLCVIANSQEPSSTESAASNPWKIELTPYFWISDLSGDATFRDRTGPVDVDFHDLLDNLDIALMGRLEAWKDEWGLFLDGLYMDLGAEFSTPQGVVSADIDVKMTILEFGIGHRLLETLVGKDNNQKLTFDLLGGGRYMNLKGEVDIVPGGPLGMLPGKTFSRRGEWVDPFIGGRLRCDLNDKLAAGVRFDFGGFGVGEGSDLTWNLLAGFDYKLKENKSLKVGYRIFDIDYDSGSDGIGMDVQFRGPILSLTTHY